MTVNVLAGPTSQKAYVTCIKETFGSEGTYLTGGAQVPVTDATCIQAGGVIGLEPVLGQRTSNIDLISTELTVSGDINGPYTAANAFMLAAMNSISTDLTAGAGAKTANDLGSYSLDVFGGGGLTSDHVSGALFDKFTLKGAVGSPVTYSASYKAQKAVSAASVTPTVITSIEAIGLKAAAVTVATVTPAFDVTAFEVSLDNAVKTQVIFNGTSTPKYVFATIFSVTGKLTIVTPGASLVAGASLGGSLTIVLTRTVAETWTMANCFVTKAGNAIKVGDVTMQEVEFLAKAVSGPALVITDV